MKPSLQQFDNVEQTLEQTGEWVTLVHGVSMYPMLRYMKDPVYLVPVKSDLKPYDVAAYADKDRYIVHRILEVHEDFYVFRGDNCIGKEYVPKKAVIGKADGFWRFGRYIPTSSLWFKCYSRLWVAINPLVRFHHKAKNCLVSLYRRMQNHA